MTTLDDRPNSGLLVIDVQRDVVAKVHDRDVVIANIRTLVDRARDEQVPVIWVQHSHEGMPRGSAGWEYVSELQRHDSEPLVHKEFADSFEATDLESVLADRRVGRLVVTGAQTDECVRSTLHGALVRGYDVTLVEDAHSTEDLRGWGVPVSPEQVIAHTNTYWGWTRAPGRRGDTAATAEVDFAQPRKP